MIDLVLNFFLISPDNNTLMKWNFCMSNILLFSCVTEPIQLAFLSEEETKFWRITNQTVDILFMIDIIVCFNTAFINLEDLSINRNRWEISKKYLKGWFFIDFIAIVPFDKILSSGSFNSLVRFTRIGRLSKLIKLTRLLRVLKILNTKKNGLVQME